VAKVNGENVMSPVEKMAARLLGRHNLMPPYDLNMLVEQYAIVEYHDIPLEKIDGVTIGTKESKPIIIINKSIPETRQKFTLAHELGHIIIPWHTGTTVSHITEDCVEVRPADYWEMEREANQFAAELLLPSSWLLRELKNFASLEVYLKRLLEKTDVSRDAMLIKVFNTIDIPVVCMQIIDNSTVKNYKSLTTPKNHDSSKKYPLIEHFSLGDRNYESRCFFNTRSIEETELRSWRELLTQLLNETNSVHLQKSINSKLAFQFQKYRSHSIENIYSLVLQTFEDNLKFKDIVLHPLFSQYVVKRLKELKCR
jgi:Zn-dependent peptidase ImmA (M78 family)